MSCYYIENHKKSYFSKFFFINKKFKLKNLRGLKSIILQKFIDYEYENSLNLTYSAKLIENFGGIKPSIQKIVFKSMIKKKKYIVILVQSTLHSSYHINSVICVVPVYIINFISRLKLEEKIQFLNMDLYSLENSILLKLNNFSYLFSDSLKMMEYMVLNYEIFDLLIVCSFFSYYHKNIFLFSFYKFLKSFLNEKA